jgi:hypothetical protein
MVFTKEDFTEEELILLKLAFKLLDTVAEETRELHWNDDRNTVYDLKNKLGIYDLVEG